MKPRLLVVLPIVLLGGLIGTTGRSGKAAVHPASDSASVQVKVKNTIRLYPNPTYNGSISVSSQTSSKIYFYIFDLEGTMIHQSMMVNRQKVVVNDLRKGVYLYDVFKDDVSIEQGKIIVR